MIENSPQHTSGLSEVVSCFLHHSGQGHHKNVYKHQTVLITYLISIKTSIFLLVFVSVLGLEN